MSQITIGAKVGSVIVGGTTGSVLFIGPGSTIAQDNANFFWDDSNNRLGLGTASPGSTLHVVGQYSVGANAASVGVTYSMNNVIAGNNAKATVASENVLFVCTSDSANPLGITFKSNGAAASANRAMYLQATEAGVGSSTLLLQPEGGNVGIIDFTVFGISSVDAKLEVNSYGLPNAGNQYGYRTVLRTHIDQEGPWQQLMTNDAAGINAHVGFWVAGSSGPPGTFVLSVGNGAGSFLNPIYANPTTGNVGIGNVANLTAQASLDINGSFMFSGQAGFFGHALANQPAAYTPTNVSTDRSYNAAATTLGEIANVLGTLIADLQSIGLLQ